MCKFKFYVCVFIIFILLVLTYLVPISLANTTYVWSNNSKPVNSDVQDNTNSDSSNSLNLESESAILIEQSTRSNFV